MEEEEKGKIDKIKLLFKNATDGAPKTTYSNSVLQSGHSVRARYAHLFGRPASQMTASRSDMGRLNLFSDGLSEQSGKQVNLVVNKPNQSRPGQGQRLQHP